MSSEETEFFNILGVGKNGTTLLGSLIDNHPQISTYPMEMKFVGHYFNTIQDKSFEGVLNFLFYKSKVSLIKNLTDWNEKEKEFARVVVGNLSEISFDTKKFKEIVYDKYNNKYTEYSSDNNVNICKLSGTLVRDIISNNLPNNGYLIDDKIYKYLKKQKASNRKIFIN